MQNQTLKGISSSAVTPQINYPDIITQMQQALQADAQKLLLLHQQGLVTDDQAQYFTNKLIDTQKQINLLMENMANAQVPEQTATVEVSPGNQFDLFNQERPDFFNKAGRDQVLSYIRNLDMDKDEISKIANLIELIENSAIESYLKQSAHDKTLNDENFAAKQKLTSYAQKAAFDSNNNKVFTREDIGNMSGEEFAKNEKLIMEQVRQGLIK